MAAPIGVDIPGLNSEVVQQVMRATVMTCNAFRGSDHGNARPHTTGESIRCLNCDDPQWKHWLRQAVVTAEHLKSQTVPSPSDPRSAEAIKQVIEQIDQGLIECPSCGGSGQVELGRHVVTLDMAIDAGDRSMAGMDYGPEFGPCDECGGTGTVQRCATCAQARSLLIELGQPKASSDLTALQARAEQVKADLNEVGNGHVVSVSASRVASWRAVIDDLLQALAVSEARRKEK